LLPQPLRPRQRLKMHLLKKQLLLRLLLHQLMTLH
jgi:hypothetical protein